MTMISLFRMIELVGQKLLAAALIVGLSLGFGFLPAVLAKKYLQHSQKSICSTHIKILRALAKFWDKAVVNYKNFLSKASTIYLCPLNAKVIYFQV